ncbi:MAG TPA: MBL fold metallo-hydrolase [Agitococcus sp.]|jgi:L-ascorbate metabolism protein UlaG (beta-lactamase superfamily)|nr:MBL fold metallo-hydrolase [Moraxellaceae bacterium]HQV79552.1 MBL fold metallo-hydrolase [Agitococcus sp.]
MIKQFIAKTVRHLLKLTPQHSIYSAALPQTPNAIELSYLGTAGFIIKNKQRTVVLDPYLSRIGVTELLRPLHTNTDLLKKYIPQADEVLIGHAHYDHILDAPDLCKQTGARLIGSSAACMVGRAAGLPESQLVQTEGREDIACGAWTVRGLPSIHGKAIMGRIPIAGDILSPPVWPPKLLDLKHGLVLNWLVDTGSLKIVHIDSADFINQELQGIKADVVCLCAIGRKYRPNYVKDVVALLQPKWIIPCHWDTMFTPYENEPDYIPSVDLAGFIQEIKDAGVEPIVMPMRGTQWFTR